MNKQQIELNPNLLVKYLQKSPKEFTRADIIDFVVNHDIEMLNLRYVAEDGRLKSLNFVINSLEHLEDILTHGERVDGSSLFSFIEAGSSDLYVIPRYSTAFLNPFEEVPTLDILCSYYTFEGKPLESAPEYMLKKAADLFRSETGFSFMALGELEYYVIADAEENKAFPATDQKGYHESDPFTKFDFLRKEAMQLISQCGGKIKYGHSEVGNFTTGSTYYEQQEIEFLPCEVETAADQLVIAKWIIRKLADDYEVNVSFAPKITVGKAGSGLHIHMMAAKDGINQLVENGKLGETARRMIAGILEYADALTAFGNTIPTSYLRLVPHQEAPTNICWGDRNRSTLIRVPLGWIGADNIINQVNPQEKSKSAEGTSKQTFEIRSGDGSADLYPYLSAIIVAALAGFRMENALQKAQELYVDVNIFKEEHKARLAQLKALPASCHESALALQEKREYFESTGVFPKGLIDNTIKKLMAFDDKNLSERLYGKNDEIAALVEKYLHTK